MLQCKSCGTVNKDDTVFCTKCGQPLDSGISDSFFDRMGMTSSGSGDDLLDFDFGVDFGTKSERKESDSSSFAGGLGGIKSSLDFGSLASSLNTDSEALDAISTSSDSALSISLDANESSLQTNLSAFDTQLNALGTSSDRVLENAAASVLSDELIAAGTALKGEAERALSGEAVKNVSSGARDVNEGVQAVKQGVAQIRQAGAALKQRKGSLKTKASAAAAGAAAVAAGAKQIVKGVRQGEEGILQIKEDVNPQQVKKQIGSAFKGVKRFADQVQAQQETSAPAGARKTDNFVLDTYSILDDGEPMTSALPKSQELMPDSGVSKAAAQAADFNANDIKDVASLLRGILTFTSNKHDELSNICDEYRMLLSMDNASMPADLASGIAKQEKAAEKMLTELLKARQKAMGMLNEFQAQVIGNSGSGKGGSKQPWEWISLAKQENDNHLRQQQDIAKLVDWYKSNRTHIRSLLPVSGGIGAAAAGSSAFNSYNDYSADNGGESGGIEINASCIAFVIFLAMIFLSIFIILL